MTRAELRTRIQTHLLDTTGSTAFWTDEDIHTMIHDGQEVQAEEVRAWRRTVVIPQEDGRQFYDLRWLAPDCMAPYRLWDETTHRRLTATTMAQLNASQLRWLLTTSSQMQYWYPVSWGRFGVMPAPTAAQGSLRVEYLAWPTPLLDDGDEPEGAEADHDALVLYGAYAGLLQQGELARATERFVQFTAHWRDNRVRNEIARMQAGQPQRQRRR